MSWQKSGGAFRVICGVVVGATGTALIMQQRKKDSVRPSGHKTKTSNSGQSFLPLQNVLASWTTNFTPSVEWDNNWDRSVDTGLSTFLC